MFEPWHTAPSCACSAVLPRPQPPSATARPTVIEANRRRTVVTMQTSPYRVGGDSRHRGLPRTAQPRTKLWGLHLEITKGEGKAFNRHLKRRHPPLSPCGCQVPCAERSRCIPLLQLIYAAPLPRGSSRRRRRSSRSLPGRAAAGTCWTKDFITACCSLAGPAPWHLEEGCRGHGLIAGSHVSCARLRSRLVWLRAIAEAPCCPSCLRWHPRTQGRLPGS